MAMTGLAYPVAADCTEDSSGALSYSNSVVIGRACRFRLEPHYDEDASEYTDLNDLDPRHEFSYADFTLTLAEAGTTPLRRSAMTQAAEMCRSRTWTSPGRRASP